MATDTGHRGPRIDCGEGHLAEFVGYRDKQVESVLGRVTVRRAWYHCAECEHGIAPRDDDIGVAGASLSPGLRSMTARAAAAEPFAAAADLLAELAGIRLSAQRINVPPRPTAPPWRGAHRRSRRRSLRRVGVLPACGDRGEHEPPGKIYMAITAPGCPWWRPRSPTGPARAPTAGPAPARSNSPACSPKPP